MNAIVTYRLPGDTLLSVPLWRASNRWDYEDVVSYEKRLLDLLALEAIQLGTSVQLIDCGADIGLFPALLRSRRVAVSRVVALEPNPVAFEYLQTNLSQLGVPAEARLAAAGERSGRGTLHRSPTDPDDHARFIEECRSGDVEVTTVADLDVEPGAAVLLKVDVEGGERGVLRGALPLLTKSPKWIVAFEAHRDVCTRTGIDPIECIRLLHAVRACRITVAESPEVAISLDQGYYQQVRERRITNIVCVADGSAR